MKELIVKDFMQSHVPTINPETELSKAIDLLKKHHLIGSPVTDTDKKPIGYLSEHELLKPMLHASYYCDSNLKVSDVMRHESLTVSETSSLFNLAEKMLEAKPKNYPVVNEKGQIIGVITRTHVLAALSEAYNHCHPV
ncbi:CBS domain-containing protein [Parashewanella spongiae]|uniref:CBS domain-containing protein n=2 Tax=Parashewanella spongiae TaxID=342950 RepID=A0A3A6TRC6_9GAMM|nr:CBS domain-containing protein [Parashewanella spongiae]